MHCRYILCSFGALSTYYIWFYVNGCGEKLNFLLSTRALGGKCSQCDSAQEEIVLKCLNAVWLRKYRLFGVPYNDKVSSTIVRIAEHRIHYCLYLKV